MGIFSESIEANYKGNLIEVEAMLGMGNNWKNGVSHYRLVINNEVVDERTFHLGRIILRGFVNTRQGTRDSVRVIINQGLLRTSYILEINGQDYNFIIR